MKISNRMLAMQASPIRRLVPLPTLPENAHQNLWT